MKKVKQILALLIWTGASFLSSQYLVGMIMKLILGEHLQETFWFALYSLIAYGLAVALVVFVPWRLFKSWKTDREEIGLRELPTWADIGLAPIGFVVYLVAGAALVALFGLFPWFNANEVQEIGFQLSFNVFDRLLAFVMLVVVAPVAEEVIFRGWLYGKLREETGMWLSIFLTSLLFALMHGQWNVGVNVFALSVVLCGLREVTGTIYSGILLHILKNAVAFYLVFVAGIR